LLNQITVAQLVPFTFINTYYQIGQPIWTSILPNSPLQFHNCTTNFTVLVQWTKII
jgi:hypothetical protein